MGESYGFDYGVKVSESQNYLVQEYRIINYWVTILSNSIKLLN